MLVIFFDKKSLQVSVPIWIGTYKFKNKIYRVCINWQNGTIDAERPYSIVKISLFTLSVLSFIIAIFLYINPNYLDYLKNLMGI